MKNYNDLKNSIFNMAVYIDCDKHIQTRYFINIKQNTVRRLLQNENYIIVCIRSLSFEEYVNNNLDFSEFEQYIVDDDCDNFKVELYQQDILEFNGKYLDKHYNISYFEIHMTSSEIKELWNLQTYHSNEMHEYFLVCDWEYAKYLLNDCKK